MSFRRFITRGMGVSLVAAGLLIAAVDPAAASHGEGLVSGVEDQVDAADPPNNGTVDVIGTPPNLVPIFGVCAKAADNEFVPNDGDNLSAQYTLGADDGTLTVNGSQVTGAVTIGVTTTEPFHFGPQGTHYGLSLLNADCGASNLGRLSPVPATVTVSITSGATTYTCTETGTALARDASFYREGADLFVVTATFASASPCGATTVEFTGVYQPPCGLPFVPPCINGRYTQH